MPDRESKLEAALSDLVGSIDRRGQAPSFHGLNAQHVDWACYQCVGEQVMELFDTPPQSFLCAYHRAIELLSDPATFDLGEAGA